MYSLSIKNITDMDECIQNLSLTIKSNEVCYFLCENGVGKILFEILCGYNTPQNGSIFLNNTDWLNLSDDRRSILNRRVFGIAAEKFPLIDQLTVEENVAFSGLLDGNMSKVTDLAKAFHIEHLLKTYPSAITYVEKLRCICAVHFITIKK